jgi:hypothetical protein
MHGDDHVTERGRWLSGSLRQQRWAFYSSYRRDRIQHALLSVDNDVFPSNVVKGDVKEAH